MPFPVESARKETILVQYSRNLSAYPAKKAQIDRFAANLEETEAICLKFLYGSMHPNDILSFSPQEIHTYVTASLQAYDEIEYVKTIPQDLFFAYVLSHRVNAEWLDFGRSWLMEQLLPLVSSKSMEDAALAVNYWCYSYATYAPADERTLGPLAVIQSTLGRCGEESVLTVSALRSVGLPARQVYAPRWSHCDDNHAWVEVWIDGQWHYLGACEPEPVLDKGWFTAAASRSMLVHSKAWTCFPDPQTASTTPVYCLVNATGHYAKTTILTVHVTQDGQPAAHIPVEFQIDNYSELFPIHHQETDAQGLIHFETGLGDLCVSIVHEGRILLKRVDLRHKQHIELALEAAVPPEDLPAVLEFNLVPPKEGSQPVYPPVPQAHLDRMAQSEAHRMARKASFHTQFPDAAFAPFVEMARCNFQEVEAFVADPGFTPAEKLALFKTLRKKDFVDIRKDVLADAVLSARPYQAQYPADIWSAYILAPRILDEMLLPERQLIKALFPAGFSGPEAILSWMRAHLTILPDYHVRNFYPSVYGCLTNRQLPGYCFGLVFTSLCRTFGFPARCSPVTQQGEWLELHGTDAVWHGAQDQPQSITLSLSTDSLKPVSYGEHFTLGRWNGDCFETLQLSDLVLEGQAELKIPAGFYRMITTTRQIDGTASVRLSHFSAYADRAVCVHLPADETAQRLKDAAVHALLPAGEIRDLLALPDAPAQLLIFAEPGAEPTEHLLQELLECQAYYNQIDCDIHIFVRNEQDPTLQLVQRSLRRVHIHLGWDDPSLDILHRTLEVGDQRLPFVMLHSKEKKAVYGSANYNIRMAQTLLSIYQIIA